MSRAVRELQRLDRDVIEAELIEHGVPVGEAVVEQHALLHVAGKRDASCLARGAEHDRELERAQILRLVDQDVLVNDGLTGGSAARQVTAEGLVQEQDECVVFDVEPSALRDLAPVDAGADLQVGVVVVLVLAPARGLVLVA